MISTPNYQKLKPQEVLNQIQAEYPQLRNPNLRVIKQYRSKDGRLYNTFLIESRGEKFDRFIAKGKTHTNSDLEVEREVLILLEKEKFDAPRLLFPAHIPQNFILITLIDGESATSLIQKATHNSKIFRLIGIALKALHQVETPSFGKFWEGENTDWFEFMAKKFTERITPWMPVKAIKPAKELFCECEPILKQESKENPVLIHRDIYTDNFLIDPEITKATLIDFAMTLEGRPVYDLAKFYVLNLYYYPQHQEDFLTGYDCIARTAETKLLLKINIAIELMGMIGSRKTREDDKNLKAAQCKLIELFENRGPLDDLLNDFCGD